MLATNRSLSKSGEANKIHQREQYLYKVKAKEKIENTDVPDEDTPRGQSFTPCPCKVNSLSPLLHPLESLYRMKWLSLQVTLVMERTPLVHLEQRLPVIHHQ